MSHILPQPRHFFRLHFLTGFVFSIALMRISAAELSPFGIGACNQTSQELEKWIPQMEDIGLHVMRTCRAGWGGVEPAPGKWDWTELDRQMKYLGDHHFEFGGLLPSKTSCTARSLARNTTRWAARVSAR